MPVYHTLGQIPRKRHTVFRRPDGGLYSEQLIGSDGFVGPSSLMYHIHAPTTVKAARRVRELKYEGEPRRMLRHRHFRTAKIAPSGSPTLDRRLVAYNDDVAVLFVAPAPATEDAHFFRNAQGDEVVFVMEGEGTLETQFGDLPFAQGDYVVIHRGIMHRYRFAKPARLLVFESRGHVRPPARYLNRFGQIVEGAPYSERDVRVPRELKTHDERGDFPVVVKQYNGFQEFVLDHHPFDVIGWDGIYYPWAFNIADFEPVVGKVVLPPPVHQTFESDGFMICSFCPRPGESHPDAVPALYSHSNVGSDEMTLYLSSDFPSRRGIGRGSITIHPDGIPHGPHPGSTEASVGARWTGELAVMMSSSAPLKVAREFVAYEDDKYQFSWLGGDGDAGRPAP